MASYQRLGLALSGGGFRASFFHIGLLARLADCDLLRHVEVISTVSGGSIIGALYYLKLKMLLEKKSDHEIAQADYQELVADMSGQFRRFVQGNPRLRTFINPLKNLKMANSNYSRSDRIGELFDAELYRPACDGPRRGPVLMRELLIQPAGEERAFKPDLHNVGRKAKVPILLINATTLNTGRNWRFEAVRMGEPQLQLEKAASEELDKRMRLLRPPTYEEMTCRQRDIPLGHAVAASAAVPGIFHPLAISGLYQGARVELVDGGVHDNQGVGALLDRNCTQLIVSDGSAQLEGERYPGTAIPAVLMRSNSVLSSRVREEQILRAGRFSLCLLHLRRGLSPRYLGYFNASGRVVAERDGPSHTLSRYDTDPEVQELLATIRTDLDAFNDTEAFALMSSGYRIATYELRTERDIWALRGRIDAGPWDFEAVDRWMRRPNSRFTRVLQVGKNNLFKVFRLRPRLAWGFLAVMLALGAALYRPLRDLYSLRFVVPTAVPTVPAILVGLALVAALAIARSAWRRSKWFAGALAAVGAPLLWLQRFSVRALPPVAGALFIYAYLAFLNPIYLRAGRITPDDGFPVNRGRSTYFERGSSARGRVR